MGHWQLLYGGGPETSFRGAVGRHLAMNAQLHGHFSGHDETRTRDLHRVMAQSAVRCSVGQPPANDLVTASRRMEVALIRPGRMEVATTTLPAPARIAPGPAAARPAPIAVTPATDGRPRNWHTDLASGLGAICLARWTQLARLRESTRRTCARFRRRGRLYAARGWTLRMTYDHWWNTREVRPARRRIWTARVSDVPCSEEGAKTGTMCHFDVSVGGLIR